MDNIKAKRVSISFGTKYEDQLMLNWLLSKKDKIGISDYIKELIKNDPDYIKEKGEK